MSHLSHKTLVYLPEMRPEHEAEEGQPRKSLGSFSSWPHRLENVFPVYAMGTSNPAVLDSSLHTSDCLDPIWDAVREEAKLEVPIKVFLSFFLFFMHYVPPPFSLVALSESCILDAAHASESWAKGTAREKMSE